MENSRAEKINENSRLVVESVQARKVRAKEIRNWILGVFFLVCVAFIWTFASVLVQYIFNDMGFKGPFFLTYIGTSLFAIQLPIWKCCVFMGWVANVDNEMDMVEEAALEKNQVRARATMRDTIRLSGIIAPVWFIANYTYNQSLGLTSITSSTVISSTSSIFTYFLSIAILKERYTGLKMLGVLFCMLGNILTVWKDSPSENATSFSMNALGDLLALVGAITYGLYTVAIRKGIPHDNYMSVPLFFGYLGLFNAVFLFPVVVGLHYTDIESLSNLSWQIVFLLVVKGLFDNVLSDYLWARAVVLTSPTVATIGLSLTIPMAIFSDHVLQHIQPDFATYVASTMVLIGFIIINVSSDLLCSSSKITQRAV